MTIKILAGAILLSIATVALGAERWIGGLVLHVYPQSNGMFAIILDQDSPYCTGSENPKRYWVQVGQANVTADGAKQLFASALAAAASNRGVSLVFDDSTPNCYVNRMMF